MVLEKGFMFFPQTLLTAVSDGEDWNRAALCDIDEECRMGIFKHTILEEDI
jgi:hypothetical protein